MIIEYKGYIAQVEPDFDEDVFHGEVINTNDVITFQADNLKDLKKELAASVEDYLAFCAERNEPAEKPFSGKFPVRTTSEIHKQIFLKAKQENISMNLWIEQALKDRLYRE